MAIKTGKFIFGIFIVVAAFALGYVFLSSYKRSADAQPYTGPVQKIVIGNVGEYSIFNLIANRNGYFTKNGLIAEIREFESGPPGITALLAGEVDVAVAADFAGVRTLFTTDDLQIVTEANKHTVFHVVGRKAAGIAEPADLKGKRIGTTRKGAGEFYLGRFLTFNNLALEDVTIVDLPPLEMVRQMEVGEIDAVSIFDPHAYNIQKKLGDAVVAWSAQGGQKTFALVYSTHAFTHAHPDIVERYLKSLVEAESFVNDHPDDAQHLVAELLAYDPEYVRYMWGSFTFIQALERELLLTMEDQARWVISNHLTERTEIPNYIDHIYFDGLEKAKPQSITILR